MLSCPATSCNVGTALVRLSALGLRWRTSSRHDSACPKPKAENRELKVEKGRLFSMAHSYCMALPENVSMKRIKGEYTRLVLREMTLEETLLSVWQQVLVENAPTMSLGNRSYAVKRTSRSRLRAVDFECEGQSIRGLEQNPNTSSRWAELARNGKKVMQFLVERQYVASVVEGKVQFYGGRGDPRLNPRK